MEHGKVYVMRWVGGEYIPLELEKQDDYREWSGSFCAL